MARTRKLPNFLVVLILLASTLAFGQDLCPSRKPLPEGVDDLRMVDGDFTFSKAGESICWLEDDVWNVFRDHKTTEELLRSTERFGIPFPNSVCTVKGTILRQQALLERERLEVAKLKLKTGSGSKANVAAAERRFEIARREFCRFLEKAKWVD